MCLTGSWSARNKQEFCLGFKAFLKEKGEFLQLKRWEIPIVWDGNVGILGKAGKMDIHHEMGKYHMS